MTDNRPSDHRTREVAHEATAPAPAADVHRLIAGARG